MPNNKFSDCLLFINHNFEQVGVAQIKEVALIRHRQILPLGNPAVESVRDPVKVAIERGCCGIIMSLSGGIPSLRHLVQMMRARYKGLKVFFYWSFDEGVDYVSSESVLRYWLQWNIALVVESLRLSKSLLRILRGVISRSGGRRKKVEDGIAILKVSVRRIVALAGGPNIGSKIIDIANELTAYNKQPTPVPLHGIPCPPTADEKVPGTGVYLRMDYWAKMNAGGSYAHTCYVARELARVTEHFQCFMGSRFQMLDEFGVPQQVIPEPVDRIYLEDNLLHATRHYYDYLFPLLKSIRPAYIYERYCISNYAGLKLSRALNIPYILEYNGSEISLSKSFSDGGYMYEDLYSAAEQAAFLQASIITVVSEVIKENLVAAGVHPDKIIVSPNGADTEHYKPIPAEKRREVRARFSWTDSHVVVGFVGTFGGWHGIDVLAAAIPKIAKRVETARFLLVGDGNYRSLVDKAIDQAGLRDRVVLTGYVPQEDAVELMAACDIFLSPHSRNMIDSRFFGSPTKLFEYMAMGQAIVASDLEQIGHVLSPALCPSDLYRQDLEVIDERAVLCPPGDVEAVVEAVSGLALRPDIGRKLGENARSAAEAEYTWKKNVERLWRGCRAEVPVSSPSFTVRTVTKYMRQYEIVSVPDNEELASDDGDVAGPISFSKHPTEASWLNGILEYSGSKGKDVLVLGAVDGREIINFVMSGARVTIVAADREETENIRRMVPVAGNRPTTVIGPEETGELSDAAFDILYSPGHLSSSASLNGIGAEIYRLVKPGGCVIAVTVAQNSLLYWREYVFFRAVRWAWGQYRSVAAIMEANSSILGLTHRPVIRCFTRRELEGFFSRFKNISIFRHQLDREEVPRIIRSVNMEWLASKMGRYLVVVATK